MPLKIQPESGEKRVAVPRDSATLVLMRDKRNGAGNFEVLLAQRHARDVFAASAFVFPGGVFDPLDMQPTALALSHEFTADQAFDRLEEVDSPEKALGYFITALRETFEEVGILLAKDRDGNPWQPGSGDEIKEARLAMQAGELDFSKWIAEKDLVLATGDLAYIAHWVTPELRPKRFDTRFFLARAPKAQEAEPDQHEIVGCRWFTPRAAIDASASGEIRMVNATVKVLERLEVYSDTEHALAELRTCEVEAIRPKLIPLDDGAFRIVHPWDHDYESI